MVLVIWGQLSLLILFGNREDFRSVPFFLGFGEK
jgi:hypothetical protein